MIKEISYLECLTLWDKLWESRVSPTEQTSAMTLMPGEVRGYSQDIGIPTFLGVFVDGVLVGVNSLHRIDSTVRSRGLFVEEDHRGKGLGILLLRETISRSGHLPCWSFPRKEALRSYIEAGFVQCSDMFYDHIEHKSNCYVSTVSL